MAKEERSSNGFAAPAVNVGDGNMEKEAPNPLQEMDFPEGGLRAWLAVTGTACSMFCTFGYANAFGYV